jgi:hypothetical protein
VCTEHCENLLSFITSQYENIITLGVLKRHIDEVTCVQKISVRKEEKEKKEETIQIEFVIKV